MARTGRPPMPLELRRRRGRTADTDSGGRRIPAAGGVVALPAVDRVPDRPAELDDAGATLWGRLWSEGVAWLSPISDIAAVEEACRAQDDVAVARQRYRATTDPRDGRALSALGRRLDGALGALGFGPEARSRLGLTEVKRVSVVASLLAQRGGG